MENIKEIDQKLKEYNENLRYLDDLANSFGFPESIQSAEKTLEQIGLDVQNMKNLWNHIQLCFQTFAGYLATIWQEV